MEFDLKKLVEFAKKNYPQFQNFSDEHIEKFFEIYAKTTIIRQDKIGNINGFCVWQPNGEKKIKFAGVCLIGNKIQNFKDVRKFLKQWKDLGIEVTWQHENTDSNVFGLLADIYDFSCQNRI